jgi:hypothetical protein
MRRCGAPDPERRRPPLIEWTVVRPLDGGGAAGCDGVPVQHTHLSPRASAGPVLAVNDCPSCCGRPSLRPGSGASATSGGRSGAGCIAYAHSSTRAICGRRAEPSPSIPCSPRRRDARTIPTSRNGCDPMSLSITHHVHITASLRLRRSFLACDRPSNQSALGVCVYFHFCTSSQ